MKPYLIKTPNIVQKFFPNYTWSMVSDKKAIYLTFDDGPHPEITSWVMSELLKYQAKATFFCVGDNVKKYPKILEQLIQQEHSIGNHTFNHLNGWRTNNKLYFNNIDQADELIREKKIDPDGYRERTENTSHQTKSIAISQKPKAKSQRPVLKLFRPPYGKIKKSQAKFLLKKGYQIIMWDVLSADFDKTTSKEKCLQNVLKNANNGSVIVFHDSEKAFRNLEYTLPKVLEFYSKRGFDFKAL